jgi:hypothetical protein
LRRVSSRYGTQLRILSAAGLLVLLACDYLFDAAGPDVRILQPQNGGKTVRLLQSPSAA